MAIEDRRRRQVEARHRLIARTARSLAEREGWDAVTTRRLAAEIEYSQPVIYKHFASMDELIQTVALEGFGELALALGEARRAAAEGEVLAALAKAYVDFAEANPKLYDAMFTRSSPLHFGLDAVAPLKAAFEELRAAVADVAGSRDVNDLTEVVWAALHGMVTLNRNQRLRPDRVAERMDVLVACVDPT